MRTVPGSGSDEAEPLSVTFSPGRPSVSLTVWSGPALAVGGELRSSQAACSGVVSTILPGVFVIRTVVGPAVSVARFATINLSWNVCPGPTVKLPLLAIVMQTRPGPLFGNREGMRPVGAPA